MKKTQQQCHTSAAHFPPGRLASSQNPRPDPGWRASRTARFRFSGAGIAANDGRRAKPDSRRSGEDTAALIRLFAAFILAICAPQVAVAHCDTMGGPVGTSAREALQKADVTPALKWVKPQQELEVREAFARTSEVRKTVGTGWSGFKKTRRVRRDARRLRAGSIGRRITEVWRERPIEYGAPTGGQRRSKQGIRRELGRGHASVRSR